MMACNKYSGLSYPETPHLFLEFHGSEAEVESQTETIKEIAEGNEVRKSRVFHFTCSKISFRQKINLLTGFA